jgi:hypothetical protein
MKTKKLMLRFWLAVEDFAKWRMSKLFPRCNHITGIRTPAFHCADCGAWRSQKDYV